MSAWNQKWIAMSRDEKLAILSPLVQPTPHPGEPVWDESDAMADVADKLHASRDIEEVLGDLADAAPTLAWLAARVDLAGEHALRFRHLLTQAERLNKLRADELDARILFSRSACVSRWRNRVACSPARSTRSASHASVCAASARSPSTSSISRLSCSFSATFAIASDSSHTGSPGCGVGCTSGLRIASFSARDMASHF